MSAEAKRAADAAEAALDPEELLAAAERAVKRILGMGATGAEVYLNATEGATISVVGGYATPKQSSDVGVAVRVALGERLGLSGASGQADATIDAVAKRAFEAARRLPESARFGGFPAPQAAARGPAPLPARHDLDAERLGATVATAADAFGAAADVTYSGVTIHAWRSRFAVASSEGVRAWDHGAGEYVTLEARVERGGAAYSATDAAWSRGPVAERVDVGALAQDTVARARAAHGAEALAAPVDEVILAPGPASQIVNLLTPALSGRRVLAKQSPLAGHLGEAVAHEALTLRDDPHAPEGVFQQRVDHEGTPTRPLTLVAKGRLEAVMYDSASARQAGLAASTGHGWRSGVTGGIGIRPLNLVMEPGRASLQAIVEGAERAVLVNEALMGRFTANEVTGDFSLVAPFAFLVERGRVRHALPPTTVGGNVHRLLAQLREVGRDTRSYGSGTWPALRAGGVSCAT